MWEENLELGTSEIGSVIQDIDIPCLQLCQMNRVSDTNESATDTHLKIKSPFFCIFLAGESITFCSPSPARDEMLVIEPTELSFVYRDVPCQVLEIEDPRSFLHTWRAAKSRMFLSRKVSRQASVSFDDSTFSIVSTIDELVRSQISETGFYLPHNSSTLKKKKGYK